MALKTPNTHIAAEAIAVLASAAEGCSDGFVKRELLTDQSRWEHVRKDEPAAWTLVQRVAESWIAEAELRRTGENASNIAVSSFLEDALQELRRIPRRYRSDEAVQLIADLPRRIREAGEASLEEMHEFVTEPLDLSEAVEQVRTRLTGRPLPEALASFVSLSPFASLSRERTLAEESLNGTIIGLLGGSTYAHDGRKIYSSNPDEVRPDGIAANVWQRMMTHYEFRIQLVSMGQIQPGLQFLANEHRPSRAASSRSSGSPASSRPTTPTCSRSDSTTASTANTPSRSISSFPRSNRSCGTTCARPALTRAASTTIPPRWNSDCRR